MSARLDKIIAAGLLVAVVFTAVAHGAVEAWSVALFELIVVALIALWAIKAIADKSIMVKVPAAAWPLAALTVFGIAQAAVLTDSEGRRANLSMDPEATRGAVAVLLFLLVSFIIGANFFTGRERLRVLANFLVIYGLAMAVFALIQHFTWEGYFYWIKPTRRTAFGPFVNRNHFAGYMEMLIAFPTALIVSRGARREAWLFYGFAAAMMGLALVVSLSRGGMISLVAGMTFIILVSPRVPRLATLERYVSTRALKIWMKTGAVIVIAGAILAGVIWVGADPLIGRIAETMSEVKAERPNYADRRWIWKDTWAVFCANPLVGAGLGSFQTVYPIYGHYEGPQVLVQSHNDYLQLLADGGIIGGAIGLWFIIVIFRAVFHGAASRDPLLAALALASGAGIFSILVHSLFDFNLQIPSNALLFLMLSAVASEVSYQRSALSAQQPAISGEQSAASYQESPIGIAAGSFTQEHPHEKQRQKSANP